MAAGHDPDLGLMVDAHPQADAVATSPKPPYERWADLLPVAEAVAADDPYARLSDQQLADLAMLARMVRLLGEGKADAGGRMAERANRVREAFRPASSAW